MWGVLFVAAATLAAGVKAQGDICSSGLPVADGVCSNGGEIPGIAGVDYPIYAEVPRTNFRCDAIGVPGYYADVESGCQAFYICERGGKGSGFLCPNGTLFNQEVLVCDWWTHVDCKKAISQYSVNLKVLAEMEAANERLGVNQRERERLAAAGLNPNTALSPLNTLNQRFPFGQSTPSPFFDPSSPLNPFKSSPSPFGSTTPSPFFNPSSPLNPYNTSPSPFGQTTPSPFFNPSSPYNPFNTTPSPFGRPTTPFNSPFGNRNTPANAGSTPNPFAPATSPFGSPSRPFGTTPPPLSNNRGPAAGSNFGNQNVGNNNRGQPSSGNRRPGYPSPSQFPFGNSNSDNEQNNQGQGLASGPFDGNNNQGSFVNNRPNAGQYGSGPDNSNAPSPNRPFAGNQGNAPFNGQTQAPFGGNQGPQSGPYGNQRPGNRPGNDNRRPFGSQTTPRPLGPNQTPFDNNRPNNAPFGSPDQTPFNPYQTTPGPFQGNQGGQQRPSGNDNNNYNQNDGYPYDNPYSTPSPFDRPTSSSNVGPTSSPTSPPFGSVPSSNPQFPSNEDDETADLNGATTPSNNFPNRGNLPTDSTINRPGSGFNPDGGYQYDRPDRQYLPPF